MADCKFCGRPAKAAPVIHKECLEEVVSQICDYYCKWPYVCQSDERLHEAHCSKCPLEKLMQDERM